MGDDSRWSGGHEALVENHCSQRGESLATRRCDLKEQPALGRDGDRRPRRGAGVVCE